MDWSTRVLCLLLITGILTLGLLPDVLLRLMLTGWSQCEPPEAPAEVKNVHD